jgi:lipoprotein signal peptidase
MMSDAALPASGATSRRALGFGLAALALVGDQVTKAMVLSYFAGSEEPVVRVAPFLNFVLLGNRGVSFGMLNGGGFLPMLITIFGVAVTVGLIWSLWRTPSRWAAAGMGLIIGGAIGNLIDRARFGSVVDFVDFFIGDWHWFVFNTADAAICIGVALLLLDSLLRRPESPKA